MLVRDRIGGVPVVDSEGRVKGIVSESDLQPLGDEDATRPRNSAADVMTSPVVTLTEDSTVSEAARVLRRHRIKRAPVLRDGRIVGIVTQSDLLRPYLRTDGEIRADVEEVLFEDGIHRGAQIEVNVRSAVVHLGGSARDRDQAKLLTRLARGVDGAVDVRNEMQIAPQPKNEEGAHGRPHRS
jgi:predicted transcriptional regulator